jgi:hypothetical protein
MYITLKLNILRIFIKATAGILGFHKAENMCTQVYCVSFILIIHLPKVLCLLWTDWSNAHAIDFLLPPTIRVWTKGTTYSRGNELTSSDEYGVHSNKMTTNFRKSTLCYVYRHTHACQTFAGKQQTCYLITWHNKAKLHSEADVKDKEFTTHK